MKEKKTITRRIFFMNQLLMVFFIKWIIEKKDKINKLKNWE